MKGSFSTLCLERSYGICVFMFKTTIVILPDEPHYVTISRGIALLVSIFHNLALETGGSGLSCRLVHCFMVAFITGCGGGNNLKKTPKKPLKYLWFETQYQFEKRRFTNTGNTSSNYTEFRVAFCCQIKGSLPWFGVAYYRGLFYWNESYMKVRINSAVFWIPPSVLWKFFHSVLLQNVA